MSAQLAAGSTSVSFQNKVAVFKVTAKLDSDVLGQYMQPISARVSGAWGDDV